MAKDLMEWTPPVSMDEGLWFTAARYLDGPRNERRL